VRAAAHDDNRGRCRHGTKPIDHSESIEAGHSQIECDYVRAPLRNAAERGSSVLGRIDEEASATEKCRERVSNGAIVVDDKDTTSRRSPRLRRKRCRGRARHTCSGGYTDDINGYFAARLRRDPDPIRSCVHIY
jgi:hypothetical protein